MRLQLKVPGTKEVSPTETLGKFLRDVMRRNMSSFRVFSPDENASNRLQDIYEATLKTWLAEIKPEDADGTDIAPDGRVMEMLSEHTLEGWLEGYILTGRHGLLQYLRGVRPHHRFDVQPARQMAREVEARNRLARSRSPR